MTIKTLQLKNFLNTDFKAFSIYDCWTNIPSLIDGFKVSQRKAIYTVVTKDKKNTVERYASEVASYTNYHHGATALEDVLVKLARDYPTSNNVNFITPHGQFGNILNSAASASRYISVEPNANFHKWFKKEDDISLEYEYEDGEQIEPREFIPIVPTILFNGAQGVGTGYACKILNYNPADVVENVNLVLAGKKQKKLVPWYKGYQGLIEKTESQTVFTGTFRRINTTSLKITALPIGYSSESYKAILADLIEDEIIKDYDDHSTKHGWDITIYANRSFLVNDDATLITKLKLVSRESENITGWNENKKMQYFDSPESLIDHFVKVRLNRYETRRIMQIAATKEDISWAAEKIRFIQFYLKNTKWFKDTSKAELVKVALQNDFTEYEKLLSMPMWNLTKDKIIDLEKDLENLNKKLNLLTMDTAKAMYTRELKELKC